MADLPTIHVLRGDADAGIMYQVSIDPFAGSEPYVPESALLESQAALAAAREERASAEAVALARHGTISALRADLAAANARADLAYEEKALADREFVASQKIVRELVDGLREARVVMALCGPSRERVDALRDRRLPEDAAVRSIAHLGYGAIMDAAARLWCDHLESQGLPWGAAHSTGPCVKTALDAVAAIDTLLAKHAAPAPTPADAKETPAAVPGLVFGPFDEDGIRHAVAADGEHYEYQSHQHVLWLWRRGYDTETYATESEAIAAANAHNAARLAGRR